jgi:hypothetical protein
MQEIKEQLACIPADDLMTWIKIGFALRSIKGGFPLWEEWSRKSVKYKPGEPERRWRTFTPDGGCGEGTIDRIAKQYGWCPRHITADLEG